MSDLGTIELACLGRPFQLGMLYDCRRDALIPGITLWDPEMLQKNINIRQQANTDFQIIASNSREDKIKALNVSEALKASFLCGLVSVKGSAGYLNETKTSKHQSRITLQYRTTSRFEQLTMEHLRAGNIKHCSVLNEGSATHVVTAILHGAQAFFIFDHEVLPNENHQEIQGDLQAKINKIPFISIEGQASLKMNELEQEKIDKFSCTFHGDFTLKNNPVSYADAIKVYSELPKLLGEHGENAVPMTVWLYPLKKLDSAVAQSVREISVSLVRRAQQILDDVDECDIQCQDLMRDKIAMQFSEITEKLRKFKDLCTNYKTVFQKHLSKLLPSIRGGEKEEQELVEYLKRSEVQRDLMMEYLQDREQEMNVVRSYLDIMKDIPVLSSTNDLDEVVLKASSEYVIAFALSSLHINEPCLSDLDSYLKAHHCSNQEQVSNDQNITKVTEKWFSSGDAQAMRSIQGFLDFKKANDVGKNIDFCIASIPDELSTVSSIHVYERGKLISSQYELPSKPPPPVVLSAAHDCIHLQIKPPECGVKSVTSYCISYQSAQSSEWTEVFTDGVSDQVTVKDLQSYKEYRFTCKAVCHPGMSLTSDTTSFFRTRPCAPPGAPTLKRVKKKSATVAWDVPIFVGEDVLVTDYLLEFRECTEDQENSKPWTSVKSKYRECTLQGLKKDRDYVVRVFANCGNNGMSLSSPETKFSECFGGKVGGGLFLNQSSCICDGIPSIHKLNIHQKEKNNEDFNQYDFGTKVENAKSKVILILGATGAGKTTLINVMINYILGVRWEDAYRFKLIDEVTNRSQAESQTPNVSSYELHSQSGFQIPYSLTIVDTPGFGDTRGIVRDKQITEQVKSFLCSPLGIDHIDAVCFVVQASLPRLSATQRYIFDSVLSIFGKDIEENIIIMVTFADSENIQVLQAIKAADLPCQKNKKGQPTHFKFNNSSVYADKKIEESKTSEKDDSDESDNSDNSDDSDDSEDFGDSIEKQKEIAWKRTFIQMDDFFKTLGVIESKDLTQTIKVLEERGRLEKAMASLIPQITAGLSKLSEIKKFKQCLENESENMKQNENFEQEVQVTKTVRTSVDGETTNCNICFFTCHSYCFLPVEDHVRTCAVMDDAGYCIVCPEHCHHTIHSREHYKWAYETKIEKKTIKELKENFMKAKGKFMDTKQMLGALEHEYSVIEDELKKLIKMSTDCLKRLDGIALKPKSLSTAEYIEILIKTEEEEKHPGFEDRIVGLQKIKKETILMEKIARGENLLEKEDVAPEP